MLKYKTKRSKLKKERAQERTVKKEGSLAVQFRATAATEHSQAISAARKVRLIPLANFLRNYVSLAKTLNYLTNKKWNFGVLSNCDSISFKNNLMILNFDGAQWVQKVHNSFEDAILCLLGR